MNLPIFQIDAFTSRRFRGNPAAVVVMDEWLPDDVMAAIAAENNLAETAFVIQHKEVAPLRWFTPTIEVDLCGHATLAAAHVILNYYRPGQDTIRFATRSGELAVSRRNELLCMDFPARPAKPIEVLVGRAWKAGSERTAVIGARRMKSGARCAGNA